MPRDEIVLAAMPLSAELRLTTPLRVAIHPQFEASAITVGGIPLGHCQDASHELARHPARHSICATACRTDSFATSSHGGKAEVFVPFCPLFLCQTFGKIPSPTFFH